MRAIWSGALNFGLINIPVKLYAATESKGLKFHYLHRKDYSPVSYAKKCKLENREISGEEIVKGYEYSKGEYVVMEDEDFRQANIKENSSISLQNFSDENEIETVFFERPYYIEAEKSADKAYILLREALRKTNKVGVGKFVFHNREHLVAVKPQGEVLIMEQMRFASEIRPPADLRHAQAEVSPQENELALQLVNQLTSKFEPEKFKDTYSEDLMKIIEAKAKNEKPKIKIEEIEMTNVDELMNALRQSLNTVSK